MTDFKALLQALAGSQVEFILVGGVAATVHGAARLTQALDIVYSRSPENLERLATALKGAKPYPRGAPAGLPFRWDAETLRYGLNFTLTTSLGDIDLLGEILGGGTHADLLPESTVIQIFGLEVRCLDLEPLIRVKRAAGRPKDLEAIAELETIRELRREDRK